MIFGPARIRAVGNPQAGVNRPDLKLDAGSIVIPARQVCLPGQCSSRAGSLRSRRLIGKLFRRRRFIRLILDRAASAP
jgi:hypothetical protein